MNINNILIITLSCIILSACSVTPGDAARRAGQTDAAEKLYLKGANQGDPKAALKLAQINHTTNTTKAIYWYKKSIELGKENDLSTILSSYYLGDIYDYKKNYLEAKKWYYKSAEKGHQYSLYNLGGLYAENKITPSDDVNGLMWILIVTDMASSYTNPDEGHLYIINDKAGYKKLLLDRMSKDDINTSKHNADEWLASRKNK